MEKREINQLIFNILLLMLICLLIYLVVVFVRNKNLISTDAISYGMDKYNFSSCACTDSEGKTQLFSREIPNFLPGG